VMTYH